MIRSLLTSLMLFVGCGWQPDQSKVVPAPDGADAAYATVAGALGLREIPPTYWYAPDACGAGSITDPAGECVWGFRVDDVVVISTQGGRPFHELALAHEYGHLASLEQTGDSDHDHMSRYFLDADQTPVPGKIPSDETGFVGAANRQLMEAGR